MLVVIVNIHVRPECVEEFIKVTKINAECSLKEPGITRFDFLQEDNDPTRFILIEAYKTIADPAKHRETVHYKTWKEKVASIMLEPRSKMDYTNLYPPDSDWKKTNAF